MLRKNLLLSVIAVLAAHLEAAAAPREVRLYTGVRMYRQEVVCLTGRRKMLPGALRKGRVRVWRTAFHTAIQKLLEKGKHKRVRRLKKKLFTLCNGERPRPCRGFGTVHIYPVSVYDGTQVCPGKASRVIYVSAAGNDANDGLSPGAPIKTLSHARDMVDDAAGPNWVVLKRGDAWFNEDFGVLRARETSGFAGRSEKEPLVFSAYGAGTQRPLIVPNGLTAFQIWGNPSRPDFGYITISGLHLRTAPGTGGTGLRLLTGGRHIVIEDNVVQGFSTNLIIQGDEAPTTHYYNVLLKGNLIIDAASAPGPGGHSQGIYAAKISGLIFEDNVFDHNGWAGDRTAGLPPSIIVGCNDIAGDGERPAYNAETGYVDQCPAGDEPIFGGMEEATIFNHNLYLQYDGYPALVKNNIISRAASHGTQARSGGWIEGNVYVRNPLNAFIAGGALNPIFTSTISHNVVLEGNDINDSTPRGFGLDHLNAHDSVIESNIIASMLPGSSEVNNSPLAVTCTEAPRAAAFGADFSCSSRVRNNIVFNWSDAGGRGDAFSLAVSSAAAPYDDIVVENNIFQKRGLNPGGAMVSLGSNYNSLVEAGARVSFSGNRYVHPKILETGYHGGRFEPGGSEDWINFSAWSSRFEPGAAAQTQDHAFRDTCRTLATYYDDYVLDNRSNDNCAIMHDDNLFNDFMGYIVAHKNRLQPRPDLSAAAITTYISEGFRFSSR